MLDIGMRVSGLRLLLFLVLTVALPTGVVSAHGGGVEQLANAEAGPYWVSVWTQPDPLRVGTAHITVAVSDPPPTSGAQTADSGRTYREAGPPVLDATVQVAFKPLEHSGETLIALAAHEDAANKLFYEADVELPETGHWRVDITVEGPAGTGSASFETQVFPPSTFDWTLVGGLGLVGLVAVLMVQRFWNPKARE
jgi:hypothetical protein